MFRRAKLKLAIVRLGIHPLKKHAKHTITSKDNTMTLLCTGAAGYIGSHTALTLLEQTDARLIIIDDLRTGFMENIALLQRGFGDRVEFVEMDFGDRNALEALFSRVQIDGVVHFGASLIVGESVQKPLSYYHNNVANAIALLEACARFGVKYFIFSSTAAVYGEPDSALIPVREDAPLAPINPYGTSKMMVELILQDIARISPLRYVALRYFNVAGASMKNTPELLSQGLGLGQRSKNATHLIKVALECAVGKRNGMSIFGEDYDTSDGTCIRDYIHIDDLAAAHVSALDFLRENGESAVFNVGYNHGYSVKEVIQVVKEISGVDFPVAMAARRAGDPAMLIASNQKLKRHTNWQPKFNDLRTIVRSAYEFERSLRS